MLPNHYEAKLQHGAASKRKAVGSEKNLVSEKTSEHSAELKKRKFNAESTRSLRSGDRRVVVDRSTTQENYVHLIEKELFKLREDIEKCKYEMNNNNNKNNYQNIQQDLPKSHFEHLLALQKFNKFTGSNDEDFSIWFDDFNENIKQSNLTEQEKIRKFKTFLSGEARYTFEGFNHDTVETLDKAGEQMKKVFSFARDTQDWIVKLNEVRRLNTESIRVFAYRVNRMVKNAFPDAGEISKVDLAIDYFLRGLQEDIGNAVRLSKPKTLEKAIEKAEINEKSTSSKKYKMETKEMTSYNLNTVADKEMTIKKMTIKKIFLLKKMKELLTLKRDHFR